MQLNNSNSLTQKKVLVTGGAGFIGSNLCERLLQLNNQVICFDNFLTGKKSNLDSFLSNPNFKLVEGDIRNLQQCQDVMNGVEVVFHQAALGSVPRSIHDPITTNEININGFLNVISAAKDKGVKRFIYAASSSTYGDSTELPKVEERIGKPLSPYAVTKYVNELYAELFANLYHMEIIGLRYFNVFGKNQDPEGAYAAAIPKFIKAISKGESITVYGDGTQTRDFTYIENVIQANLLAATTKNTNALNQVYNVAVGERTSLNDLLSTLRKAIPNGEKSTLVYAETRPGEVQHSLASIEKAKRLLYYDPQYNLQKGLNEAIEWYLKNL